MTHCLLGRESWVWDTKNIIKRNNIFELKGIIDYLKELKLSILHCLEELSSHLGWTHQAVMFSYEIRLYCIGGSLDLDVSSKNDVSILLIN